MGFLFVYYRVVRDVSPTLFTLVFACLFALNAVAESVPADWSRVAVGLRLVSVVYATILLVLSLSPLFSGPEILF